MSSLPFRVIVTIVGFVLAFALPASAQSTDKEQKAAVAKSQKDAAQAKAKRAAAAAKNNTGEDPDPFIAQQLRRQGDASLGGY